VGERHDAWEGYVVDRAGRLPPTHSPSSSSSLTPVGPLLPSLALSLALAGFYIAASGATYEGDFVSNLFQGQGAYKWADGAEFRGGWSASRMHGEGAYTGADGIVFAGSFYNGLYVEGKTHVAVR
jgi:hypothetical protein